ncbi:Uma2 family endonuclease, partial [Ursidibacter arcticus]
MSVITSLNQLDLNRSYSYSDYLLWQLKERVEIIKGKILAMSPAPNRLHQNISLKLTGHLLKVFPSDKC